MMEHNKENSIFSLPLPSPPPSSNFPKDDHDDEFIKRI
jgi:hypothetical protein